MPHTNFPLRSDQERLRLWLHGCVLVGVVGLLAVVMMTVNWYRAYQRPLLDLSPERINPNTASIASLVRLPGIGRARALDMINYRRHQEQAGPAFGSPQDMEKIKGIGPKTAEKLAPWLTFEGQ